MNSDLVESIYDAAGDPSRWPAVLDGIAGAVGAAGGCVVVAGTNGSASFVSEALRPIFMASQEAGHFDKMERSAPMLENMFPRFITDTDFFSQEQMNSMPVYRDFLIPAKVDVAAASAFQGAADDIIVFTIDGFASHAAARAILPVLDRLRPHLGRALSLSSQTQLARDRAVVESLDLLGSGAAIVGKGGALRAYNTLFEDKLGSVATDHRNHLRFASLRTDAMFANAIAGLSDEDGGSSLVVRLAPDQLPCVMHIIPLRRTTRDIFNSDGALLLLAEGKNRMLPNSDLLRLLFDLTPAEARLARALLEGEDLRLAALQTGTSYETARVYMKGIFQKTGINKQASLIRMLAGYGKPAPSEA